MVTVTMEKSADNSEPVKALVTISGGATVRSAGEIHAALKEAFAAAGEIVLSVAAVTESDPSFIQLLYAAQRTAVLDNKQFRLEGVRAEAFVHGVEEGGFSTPVSGNGERQPGNLWMGGGK